MRTNEFLLRNQIDVVIEESLSNMSQELKVAIWDGIFYFLEGKKGNYEVGERKYPNFVRFLAHFFCIPFDEIQDKSIFKVRERLKSEYFKLESIRIYSLINYVSKQIEDYEVLRDPQGTITFAELMNIILESKGAPCRFAEYELTLLTSPVELDSLRTAIHTPYDKVNNLMLEAANYLFNGKYVSSCDAAVTAVESLIKNLLSIDNINFADAIRKPKFNHLHTALKQSMVNFWGYASQCARHGTTDNYQYDPALEETKLVLNYCSGVINLLMAKEGSCNNEAHN